MPVAETEYHFILTILRPQGTTATRAGVWTPPPGTTRGTALEEITKAAFPEQPLNAIVITFFSLEPNQL
ncbi:hypothetical protein ABZ867_12840 [Streptomyces cinnamoneus]